MHLYETIRGIHLHFGPVFGELVILAARIAQKQALAKQKTEQAQLHHWAGIGESHPM